MDTSKPVLQVIKYFDLTVGGIINSILLGRRFHKAPFFGEENMDEFRKLRSLLEEQSKLIYHHSFLMLMIAPSLRHFPYLKGAWQTMKTCSDNLFAFFRTQINLHESEIDFDTEQEPSDLAEAYLRAREMILPSLHSAPSLARSLDERESEMKRLRERRRLREQTGDEGFYSHKQLENVLYDLWIAGLETTTGSLAWLMAYILHQPEIQNKNPDGHQIVRKATMIKTKIYHDSGTILRMRAEIKSVLRPGEEVVTTEHRTQLPYCAAVIMETQRLANLIPLNFQRVTNKDTTINGFFIPAGTAIMPQISSVMYNEKIFPDPYAFDPDRFIDEDGKLKNIDQWMPFSIGARRCPGESLAKMELYLILTNLILNFEILPDDSHRIPTMERTGTTVQKPEDHKLLLRALN
ncbi:hypothetical protein PRIPAC_82830 [Pristionchus pacificus]|uniref:Cytochrome P450 n=1 Tax=Pristionchus pacificus TaxID=54126 RepID=A0A2A6BX43_PRIPA|nr:hypothetical protein PRIPAC_82830 [Pristionchus pacificus]|eukprot:PDM70480.1 cytochrome P450 [Pristionchus pacificus]